MFNIPIERFSADYRTIAEKVLAKERITEAEGLFLFESNELGLLSVLANHIRERKHGKNTYFIRNIHIEPTNICAYNCKFCSYRSKNQTDGWEFNEEEMIEKIKKADKSIREVHIVGGTHPDRDLNYYINIIKKIRVAFPLLHIKAFSAVEVEFMIEKSGLTIKDGLTQLKAAGLNSIPGGGAEIFDEDIRKQICDRKTKSSQWLAIHEAAHNVGIPSNATMLYGHIENYNHRIDHLNRLRQLQDRTAGFQAFIPLKYKNKNNEMQDIKEVSVIEDMKNYAVSRIFLDNFEHIKAYWPMLGRQSAQLALSFGVDDMDGTIDDSTKIYSSAGAEEQSPSMTADEMSQLIEATGRTPVERDALYNKI